MPSLGLSQVLSALAILLPRLWGVDFPLLGQRLPAPFQLEFSIGTVVFDGNDLIAMIVAPLALVGLAIFLRMSNVGIAIRASADSADRAALLGVPVKRLQTLVWAVASLLAFIAIFLRAGIIGLPVFGALSLGLLLRSLAALVLGRMTNLLAIGLNAVALGILEVSIGFAASSPLLIDPILAGIIIVALILTRRSGTRVDEAESSTWRSADDARPIPPEVNRIPVVQVVKWATFAVIAAAVLVVPQVLAVDETYKLATVGVYTILGLSVVVLTGWAGQVSLGQIGFFAIGAAVGAKATLDWHLDLSIAFVVSSPSAAPSPRWSACPRCAGGASTSPSPRSPSRWRPRRTSSTRRTSSAGCPRPHPPPAAVRPDRHQLDAVVLLRGLGDGRAVPVPGEGHPRQPHRPGVHRRCATTSAAAEAYGLHATRCGSSPSPSPGALAGLAGVPVGAHQIQGLDRHRSHRSRTC